MALGAIGALVSLAIRSPAFAASDCRITPYLSAPCFSSGVRDRCPALRPAPCFWVTGRLAFFNGAPVARLRPRGSRRMLGVVGGDGDAASPRLLPDKAERLSRAPGGGDRRALDGRFRVCPLTTDKPGWMRPVCLTDADRLTVSPPRPDR